MHRTLRVLRRVLVIACLAAPVASAQTTVCRAATDESGYMLNVVRLYALTTEPVGQAARDSLRIPAVSSASAVVLITKEATCKSANTAYQAAATGARQTLSGRVYVVQVGTAYVVWDPDYVYNVASPSPQYMVFDSRWAFKSTFMP